MVDLRIIFGGVGMGQKFIEIGSWSGSLSSLEEQGLPLLFAFSPIEFISWVKRSFLSTEPKTRTAISRRVQSYQSQIKKFF